MPTQVYARQPHPHPQLATLGVAESGCMQDQLEDKCLKPTFSAGYLHFQMINVLATDLDQYLPNTLHISYPNSI